MTTIHQQPRFIATALTAGALMSSAIAMSTDGAAQPQIDRYPSQTVRIVVPVSPGSIADAFARMIAEQLAATWKQQVIVENRPGLAGTTSVAKSRADGYTLFLNSNGHTIAGALNKNLQFDPVKDFAGITLIASVPLAMIVPSALPAKTVKEFVVLAKTRPGQLNVANAGVSTTSFLSAEVFSQTAGIKIVHVPYRGAPEAVNAVLRGDAHMYFAPIPLAQELAASGKISALAVNSPTRVPQMPHLPTIAEAGLPSFNYESWFGFFAPAGTPSPILRKINFDISRALEQTALRTRMNNLGAIPVTSTPEQFDAIIRNDTVRNSKLVADAGIVAK